MNLEQLQSLTRRELLGRVGAGVGSVALASLLAQDGAAQSDDADPLVPKPTHFAAKAKNVIFFHMVGAPSHLDLFEHKPALNKYDGQDCPA